MKLREPKRKCPKAVPTHLQTHVVWSQTLKCSVNSYVTVPSTKCYFDESLFMQVFIHDKIRLINGCERLESMVPWFYVRPTSERWFLKRVQVTMKHDPCDAM
jgi:hypothetical protein